MSFVFTRFFILSQDRRNAEKALQESKTELEKYRVYQEELNASAAQIKQHKHGKCLSAMFIPVLFPTACRVCLFVDIRKLERELAKRDGRERRLA